jgi:excisionase family DNA binding protein
MYAMAKPKYTNWSQVPLLLSTKDVGDVLGVHINTVKRLISDGKIPAQKIGRAWKIRKEDLQNYVDNGSPAIH